MANDKHKPQPGGDEQKTQIPRQPLPTRPPEKPKK
jgi:hypothetical protein